MDLPKFKYHPDPVKSGVFEESGKPCVCCGQARGFIYIGPVYSIEELDESLCPWCIADGSAHEKFDASFTDETGVGGNGDWEDVSIEIIKEVAYRTPGFFGWQQQQWWTHCGDAAEFLGVVDLCEDKNFRKCLCEATGLETTKEFDEFINSQTEFCGTTAYVFRCLHCGKIGGYTDCD